jgi:hypothetical protein
MSEQNLPGEAAATEFEAAAGCACTHYAVVSAAGVLVRGCGAVAAQHIGAGVYRVHFAGNVVSCAWVATIGLPDDGAPLPGMISVAGLPNPNEVQVRTFDCNCQPADRPFHFAVHCCPG